MTAIIAIIKKAMMICILYWINANISPIWILPSAIWCPPTHTINKLAPFMINIMAGIIKDMVRLMNKFVFNTFWLTSSNFFSSYFWVLNARITGIPSKNSLVTLFVASINFWLILNFGIAKLINTPIKLNNRTTHKAMIHVILASVFITWMIAPIPMIGA